MDVAAALVASPLGSGLAEPALRALAAAFVPRSLPAGAHLFHEGDPGDALYVVVSGTLAVVRTTAAGSDQVLQFAGPGDLLGEIALLQEDGRRSASVRCETAVTVAAMDRSTMRHHLEATPGVATRILGVLAARVQAQDRNLADVAFHDVAARLGRVLAQLAERQGVPVDDGRRVAVPQAVLAARVSATRETVNRVLRRWERAGAVRLERGAVVVRDGRRLR